MVTFANVGSVHLPSLKFVGLRVRKIRRIQCVSCFPVIRTTIAKKIVILRTQAFIFCLPWGRPCDNHAKRCTTEKTACQTHRSMYPSILNSFPVIRTASAKNCRFHVPQPTFLFLLETPLRLSCNMLHGWKDNSMLVKPLAACSHLSSTVSQLFEPQVQKNRRFHVPQPTFQFPLETPLRLSRSMLHGWKDNSMLAKPLAACSLPIYIVFQKKVHPQDFHDNSVK